VETLDGTQLKLWLRHPAEGSHQGYMPLQGLDLPVDASGYLCGPLPSVNKIRSEALEAGSPAHRIHYEVFVPYLWMTSAN